MAYQDTVQSRVRQAVTSSKAANLANALIIDANASFQERIINFSSMTEVNAHVGIAKDSPLYSGLAHAFSQPNGKTPIYVGRREVDDVTLTPTLANSTTYSFRVISHATDTNTESGRWDVTFTSDTDATVVEITAGLQAAIGALTILATDLVSTDNGTDISLVPAANRQLILEEVEELVQSFTITETAADCYTAITDVDSESFYGVTTTQRDLTFVLDLARQIAATNTGNHPKLFRVSDNAIQSLSAQTDPSHGSDLIGALEDLELPRVSTEWHDQSNTLFPELATFVYQGGFFPGTQSFKFMGNNTTPAARHPVLGRKLNTSEVGFILDRNSSVTFQERGNTFYHGGSLSSSSTDWIDNQIITDWINDTSEVRVLDALLNKANGGLPLTFVQSDLNIIKERVESVLFEAVDRKMLSGFTPVSIPSTISFTDQANRILNDVTWEGWFAGKIHFVNIGGVLTYKEAVQ